MWLKDVHLLSVFEQWTTWFQLLSKKKKYTFYNQMKPEFHLLEQLRHAWNCFFFASSDRFVLEDLGLPTWGDSAGWHLAPGARKVCDALRSDRLRQVSRFALKLRTVQCWYQAEWGCCLPVSLLDSNSRSQPSQSPGCRYTLRAVFDLYPRNFSPYAKSSTRLSQVQI